MQKPAFGRHFDSKNGLRNSQGSNIPESKLLFEVYIVSEIHVMHGYNPTPKNFGEQSLTLRSLFRRRCTFCDPVSNRCHHPLHPARLSVCLSVSHAITKRHINPKLTRKVRIVTGAWLIDFCFKKINSFSATMVYVGLPHDAYITRLIYYIFERQLSVVKVVEIC